MKLNTSSPIRILCLLIAATLLLLSCGCNTGEKTNSTAFTQPDAKEFPTGDIDISNLESMVNMENAVTVDLDNLEASTTSGISINGTTVQISKGGTYILSGTLTNGQISVDADDEELWLVLDNASVTCSYSAPINIIDAADTYLVLTEGSENYLEDSQNNSVDDSGDPDAALFCKNDLIIGGKGSLSINGKYDKAIHTKDTLTIGGGTLNLTSVDSAVVAKDGVLILDGTITLDAGGDGIKTTNEEDSALGNIIISGGEISIESDKDAIQAQNSLSISGGVFTILTGGGAANAETPVDDMMGGHWYSDSSDSSYDDVSLKALKAYSDICIDGGEFNIDCEDDAVHSNANVEISDGVFLIKAGDDGIHTDSSLNITGGDIQITQSYEGAEGMDIHISGGNISIVSSDDGMNAAGGSDDSNMGYGRPDHFSSSSDYVIDISGGYIFIDASGDGIDSNGNLEISGGTTIVSGPTNNSNGSLDFQNSCIITGGTLVATGPSGMAESISSESTQGTMVFYLNYSLSAETVFNVSGDSSDFSLSVAPEKVYNYICISSPDITLNESYTVSIGGEDSGTNADGIYSGGSYSGGEEAVTFTQDSTVTTVGSGGMGGMGSMGGMGGPGGMGGMGGRP